MSLKQAASLHDVREDTTRSWSSGRRQPPTEALDQLRDLYDQIQTVADNLVQHLEDLDVDDALPLEIAVCTTDAEAVDRGLPFAACHQRAIACALTVILNPVELVTVAQSTASLVHARPAGNA
ncbi:MAG: hypothetical protein P1U65_07470 [Minwuia sp.]|nr:hypothetical protein [Minwuia sp.]